MIGRRGLGFWLQLVFTLLVSAFLILPALLSALAGVTANYFVGIRGGLTLRWISQVWEHYAGTIGLSLEIAIACTIATLLLGVSMAYALARRPGRIARLVEELLVM